MGMWIGKNRKARVTYGFDEISLAPGEITINPNEVDITFRIPTKNEDDPICLRIPILASAMDGVVDVPFAKEMGLLGGLAVLNLEGIQTRYENPEEIFDKILKAEREHVTSLLQKLYREPVREELIVKRIQQIKDSRAIVAVSSIPQKAGAYGSITAEAGADIFVIQSTVSTVRHLSSEYKPLDIATFCRKMP